MGFLFKGSTTVVQAPQQSQTTYDIPDYLKEFQSSLLDRANVESRGAYQGYTQDRIAPLSTAETAAGGIIAGEMYPLAGGLANIGAQKFDTAMAQSYMNPYSNTVISGVMGDLEEQYQKNLRGINQGAVGAGAFGGARHGVERGLAGERYLDTVADTTARLRQAGFESGAQRFQADRQAELASAGGQLQALGGVQQQLGQFGALGRGLEQQKLIEEYRDFIEEREYPREQVRFGAGILAGAPIRSYGQERTGMVGQVFGQPSIAGQLAGLGAAYGSMQSDIRLKENVKRIGQSPSGINIYSFNFIGNKDQYEGVMAHEVPYASTVDDTGYWRVDYSQLDVEFKKVN
jgi:hypothetical protein